MFAIWLAILFAVGFAPSMPRQRWINCRACHFTSLRLDVAPGTVQQCQCGHPFLLTRQPTHTQVAPPRRATPAGAYQVTPGVFGPLSPSPFSTTPLLRRPPPSRPGPPVAPVPPGRWRTERKRGRRPPAQSTVVAETTAMDTSVPSDAHNAATLRGRIQTLYQQKALTDPSDISLVAMLDGLIAQAKPRSSSPSHSTRELPTSLLPSSASTTASPNARPVLSVPTTTLRPPRRN